MFDFASDRSFPTSITNIAAETHFNRLAGNTQLEAIFSQLEDKVAPAVTDLLERASVRHLDNDANDKIMQFILSQLVRTRAFREQIKDLDTQIHRKLKSEGASDETIQKYILDEKEESAKILSVKLLFDLLERRHELLGRKVPILFDAQDEHFILSDNPVILHNDNDFGPYGNLGLLVHGVQIYVPISPRYCFAYYCSSILLEMQRGIALTENALRNAKATRVLTGHFNDFEFNSRIKELEEKLHTLVVTHRAIELGGPALMSRENVVFLNSLSIAWAERQVFAKRRADLALAIDIARKHPEHAAPRRMAIQ